MRIALEGIVHAGKTTLLEEIRKLRKGICCIDEYTVYRGSRPFPAIPTTSSEALEANPFFIGLEKKRFADIHEAEFVLLDRSCLSVLAYHYATEKASRGQILCFESSLRLFRDQYACYLPDVVLYLKISQGELSVRHVGDRGDYKQDLLAEEFNKYLLSFYEELPSLFPKIQLYEIDGTLPKDVVLRSVLNILAEV